MTHPTEKFYSIREWLLNWKDRIISKANTENEFAEKIMYEVRNGYADCNKAEINAKKVNFGSLDQIEENCSIISKANEYEIVC